MPEHITLVVHKELVIKRRHEDTFRLFTESFGAWWPVATHSINEDKVLEAILDGREGGADLRTHIRRHGMRLGDHLRLGSAERVHSLVETQPRPRRPSHHVDHPLRSSRRRHQSHLGSHWLGRLRRRCQESPGHV